MKVMILVKNNNLKYDENGEDDNVDAGDTINHFQIIIHVNNNNK